MVLHYIMDILGMTMAMRKRISRTNRSSDRVYVRAGEGPAESPFADLTEEQRRSAIQDMRRQEATWQAERKQQPPVGDFLKTAIRHGVKSERDTQPVQVRMLRAQIRVLKQVAEQEGRNSSDVIRDLVDAYIAYCVNTWPEGPRLDILRAALRAEEYTPAQKGFQVGASAAEK
jgi:hypothetical protein